MASLKKVEESKPPAAFWRGAARRVGRQDELALGGDGAFMEVSRRLTCGRIKRAALRIASSQT
jgi:hypothetical protein